jgi:hypothetical protein
MEISNIFWGLAIAAAVANTVFTILIMVALDKRNIPTNVLLSRIYIFKYLSQYKKVTTQETGRPGPLWGLWITSINLIWIFGIAGFLVR